MQRLPWVTEWSCGEPALTITSSCTVSDRVQPTPQNGQIVSVVCCAPSSQVPAERMSNSVLAMSAPVGQTSMQLPQ